MLKNVSNIDYYYFYFFNCLDNDLYEKGRGKDPQYRMEQVKKDTTNYKEDDIGIVFTSG